jgi:hypothetical protein
MKPNFCRVLSVLLVCSFVFSSFSPVFAGNYQSNCPMNKIYSSLHTAYNIVKGGMLYTDIQNARPYLSHAQRQLKNLNCSRHHGRKLNREIDRAKTEILWNNRQDALARISCAIRMVENMHGQTSQAGHYNHNARSGAGILIAAPVAIGLGALLAGIFNGFNWGGMNSRVTPPNMPGSVVPVR